jgi:hypothetical protein
MRCKVACAAEMLVGSPIAQQRSHERGQGVQCAMPAFLDIEASGLSDHSHPIEIGWRSRSVQSERS